MPTMKTMAARIEQAMARQPAEHYVVSTDPFVVRFHDRRQRVGCARHIYTYLAETHWSDPVVQIERDRITYPSGGQCSDAPAIMIAKALSVIFEDATEGLMTLDAVPKKGG